MIIITLYMLVGTGHIKPRITKKLLDRLRYPIPTGSTENIDDLTQLAKQAVQEWTERNPHVRIDYVNAIVELNVKLD